MKFCFYTICISTLCVLTGCSSLEDKAVVLDSSVKGFRITMGADTTSGTPLPNISAGWGSNLLITVPTTEAGTLEYKKDSGSLFGELFGVEVVDKTEIRITTQESGIKVTTETDQNKKVTTEVGGGKVSVTVD